MQQELLHKYVEAVMAAPPSLCLTATQNPKEFWERHVLDALKILDLIPQRLRSMELKVVDVGSGNGIPGIVAAIALPNWQIYPLDSNNKKCGFLDMFCKLHAIKNVHVTARRAEEYAHDHATRESFDLGFARALGKLTVALELSLPLIKREGLLAIPHGQSHKEEIARSEKAMKELGAVFQGSTPYQVSDKLSFTLLTFLKTQETPQKYPRKSGQPHKRPL